MSSQPSAGFSGTPLDGRMPPPIRPEILLGDQVQQQDADRRKKFLSTVLCQDASARCTGHAASPQAWAEYEQRRNLPTTGKSRVLLMMRDKGVLSSDVGPDAPQKSFEGVRVKETKRNLYMQSLLGQRAIFGATGGAVASDSEQSDEDATRSRPPKATVVTTTPAVPAVKHVDPSPPPQPEPMKAPTSLAEAPVTFSQFRKQLAAKASAGDVDAVPASTAPTAVATAPRKEKVTLRFPQGRQPPVLASAIFGDAAVGAEPEPTPQNELVPSWMVRRAQEAGVDPSTLQESDDGEDGELIPPLALPAYLHAQHRAGTRCMATAFSPDGNSLAVGFQSEGFFIVPASEILQARPRITPAHFTSVRDRLSQGSTSADDTSDEEEEVEDPDLGWSLLDVAWHASSEWAVYSKWSPAVTLVHRSTGRATPIYLPSFDNQGQTGVSSHEAHTAVFGVSVLGSCVVGVTNAGDAFACDPEVGSFPWTGRPHLVDANCAAAVDDRNVFCTGGDDGVVLVIDTRSKAPVGMCLGHTHGVTSIASRGDDRHIATMGKDQCIKLFDLRKIHTGYDPARALANARAIPRWDYRQGPMTQPPPRATTLDNALFTIRDASVFYTLIRMDFAPRQHAGGRYIVTGSVDGGCHYYDIVEGRKVGEARVSNFASAVRDVSWHPNGSVMAAACTDATLRVFASHPCADEDVVTADIVPVTAPTAGLF